MSDRLRQRLPRGNTEAPKPKKPASELLRRLGLDRLRRHYLADQSLLLVPVPPEPGLKGSKRMIEHLLINPKALPVEVLFACAERIAVSVSSDDDDGDAANDDDDLCSFAEPEAVLNSNSNSSSATSGPNNSALDSPTICSHLEPEPKPDVDRPAKKTTKNKKRRTGLPKYKIKSPVPLGELVDWILHKPSKTTSKRYCQAWNKKKPCPELCRYTHRCSRCKSNALHPSKECEASA